MWDKIKGYASAVLAVLTWLLVGWIMELKNKNNALQNEVADEKAKEVVAADIAVEQQDQQQAKAADKTFDQLADDYLKSHPPVGKPGNS